MAAEPAVTRIQQWLLPISGTALNGAPAGLIVDGDTVQVTHGPTVLSLSTGVATLTGGGRRDSGLHRR